MYTLVRRGGVCGVMVKDGEMLLRDVLQLVGAEGWRSRVEGRRVETHTLSKWK